MNTYQAFGTLADPTNNRLEDIDPNGRSRESLLRFTSERLCVQTGDTTTQVLTRVLCLLLERKKKHVNHHRYSATTG